MYEYPYGNGQQLNLNWIINEIIQLHKQLDPEYEAPKFSQIYPYSNLEQLNLDWILSELKALKELAPEPVPQEVDIQAVAEALVALPFDSSKSYQIYDFISKDGEIYRATEAIAAGGVWDETKWFKTKLGTDLAVLERWINAINADLTTLQNTVEDLSSADISDDSDAGGATVKASLNALKGSLNAITPFDSTPTSGSTKGVTSGGVYNALNNTTFGTITKLVETGALDQLTCVKKGNIICVSGRIHSMQNNDGANRNYFQIPEGFRPPQQVRVIGAVQIVSGDVNSPCVYPVLMTIGQNGIVNTGWGSGVTIGQVFFAATYFA